jgi:uncharacterized protein (AIM24 family)
MVFLKFLNSGNVMVQSHNQEAFKADAKVGEANVFDGQIFVRNHDLMAESCSTAGPVEVTCVSAGNIGGVFAAGMCWRDLEGVN